MAISISLFGLYVLLVLSHISGAVAQSDAVSDEQAYYAEILQNALIRYITDHRTIPGEVIISEGFEQAISICKEGMIDSLCVSFDALVPDYIAYIPVNEMTNMQKHSGFAVYLDHRSPRIVAVLVPSVLPQQLSVESCLPCLPCPVCTL